MPIRASNYAFRFPHPDVIQRGLDQTLYVEARSGADLSAPSSGTCTVYDENGDSVTTGAITVTGSVAEFAIAAATTASLDLATGWRVEWSLVMGDTRTYTPRNPAALVLRQLYPVLADQDLTEGRYSDLNRYLPSGSSSWEDWRVAAWNEIQRVLFRDQRRPWLIMEPSSLLDAHRELTYSHIFSALGMTQRSSGERDWLGLSRDHRSRFEREWRNLSFDYDDVNQDQISPARKAARPILVLGAIGADWRY